MGVHMSVLFSFTIFHTLCKESTMSEPARSTVTQKLESFFAHDCIRVRRILETAQYAVIFALLALVVGFLIDVLIEPLHPKPTQENPCEPRKKLFTPTERWRAVCVVLFQVMISAVLIIYIRKLGEVVPFIFGTCGDTYVPHWKVKEVEGEMAIGLVFIGIQSNILDSLTTLRKSYAQGNCHENHSESHGVEPGGQQ